jgi:hypothetical protein
VRATGSHFVRGAYFCAAALLFMPYARLLANSADASWADRKEYDLVLTIRSETTPQKRLQLLDQWAKQYPSSPLKEARLELYLQTYLSLANPADAFRASRELLATDPANPIGVYWCTLLLPELPETSPEALTAGERAARQLLDRANDYFKPANKPASIDAAQWQEKEAVAEALAHRSLGWASWQHGDLGTAEDEFTKSLNKNPEDLQVSAWLGIVMSLENGKQIPALWQLARATNATSSHPMPEEQRRQVNEMLEHVYASYHGGLDGLEDLQKSASAKVFPDPAFTIDSATTVAARRAEEELSLTNPELAAWLAIRRQLIAPDGQQYFAANLEAKTTPWLKGTVTRAGGTRTARELQISMTDGAPAEVTLKLTSPVQISTAPGSKLTFRGVPESFTPEPFDLVLTAATGDVRATAKTAQ